MSSSTERTFSLSFCWVIGFQPPSESFIRGFATWGMLSKTVQWHPQSGVLPFPLFQDKEEADAAFAENDLDKKGYRVVPVKVTIAEVSEANPQTGPIAGPGGLQ
jgi:hypothetical protein